MKRRFVIPAGSERRRSVARISVGMCVSLLVLGCVLPVLAQQTAMAGTSVTVPPLVNFSGALTDVNGKPMTGVVGVTFLLYKDSQGGTPLWMETQNVHPTSNGHYSVMLGSTTSTGLPSNLFVAGEARWLAVQVQGQEEQPRVVLLSVPYALKAADAETLGGLPLSAFMLADSAHPGASQSRSTPAASTGTLNTGKALPPANPTVTGKGTAGNIPMWDSTSDIINSVMFQKSSLIGIGTTVPAATLDVNGKGDIRDTLTLFPKSTDNTLAVNGTAFKVSNTGLVTFISGQKFPGAGTITGITTTLDSGLTGGVTSGNATLSLLKTCASGQILQWSGSAWACANASGSGTITGVTAGTDLTGGGTSGNVTLNLNTAATDARYAQLATSNTFSGFVDASGFVRTEAEFIANPNPNCHNFGLVALVDSACSDVALEGDGFNTFINRPVGAAISFLEGNSTTEATLNPGGEFSVFASNGVALRAFNNSSLWTLELRNSATPSNGNFTEVQFDTNGKPTFFTDTLGDTTAIGMKHAAVPLQNGQMVNVSSMESPEVWFEDFGSGQLTGGVTTVSIDASFSQIVNLSSGYHVFLTPKGDCNGLFVTSQTNQGFEVRELRGGQSSVAFDYRIVAHRNGYEAQRLPVAIMPVAGPMPHTPKLPVVDPGATATGPFSAKLNPAGAVITKKK